MEIVLFGAGDIENALVNMTQAQLDALSFGVMQVDPTGHIVLYNATEGEIAGYDPKDAIGKNFFTDVAPCTNHPGFRGKFDKGVKAGKLNVVFEWRFTGRNAVTVQVHMKNAIGGEKFWIFVKRLK